jgi:hypothetical protein
MPCLVLNPASRWRCHINAATVSARYTTDQHMQIRTTVYVVAYSLNKIALVDVITGQQWNRIG